MRRYKFPRGEKKEARKAWSRAHRAKVRAALKKGIEMPRLRRTCGWMSW